MLLFLNYNCNMFLTVFWISKLCVKYLPRTWFVGDFLCKHTGWPDFGSFFVSLLHCFSIIWYVISGSCGKMSPGLVSLPNFLKKPYLRTSLFLVYRTKKASWISRSMNLNVTSICTKRLTFFCWGYCYLEICCLLWNRNWNWTKILQFFI